MKNYFKSLLLVAVIFCVSFTSNAQKIAHIDFDSLISVMPQMDSIKKVSQEFYKTLEAQLISMNNEYQQKLSDYNANEKNWTDLIKGIKKNELEDLGKRIQDFQGQAQTEIEKENAELAKPLYDKAKKAISDVAKEKGYKLVIDSSDAVSAVLYSEPADDIFNLVKAKLGIK